MLVDVGAIVVELEDVEEKVVAEMVSEVDSTGISVDEEAVSESRLDSSDVAPTEVTGLVLVRRVVGIELCENELRE